MSSSKKHIDLNIDETTSGDEITGNIIVKPAIKHIDLNIDETTSGDEIIGNISVKPVIKHMDLNIDGSTSEAEPPKNIIVNNKPKPNQPNQPKHPKQPIHPKHPKHPIHPKPNNTDKPVDLDSDDTEEDDDETQSLFGNPRISKAKQQAIIAAAKDPSLTTIIKKIINTKKTWALNNGNWIFTTGQIGSKDLYITNTFTSTNKLSISTLIRFMQTSTVSTVLATDNIGGGGAGNVVYNDPWIQKYFIDPPPPIVFETVTATSTEVTIPWIYPYQMPIGMFNSWVPVINALSANFTIITPQTTTNNITLFTSNTTNYINNRNGGTFISTIILSKAAGTNGIISRNGGINNAYIYYNTPAYVINTSNVLRAWYINTNSNINVASTSLLVFVTAGPPGSTLITSLTTTALNATLSYTAPLADSTDPNTKLSITSYTVQYSSIASVVRYGNPVFQAGQTATTTANPYTASSLYPDSLYTFSISATNSENITGPISTIKASTINLITSYIPPSGELSFTPTYYTNANTIYSVQSPTIQKQRLLANNSALTTSTRYVTPIHTTAKRGSTANSLTNTFVTLTNGGNTINSSTITFNGFPTTVFGPITSNNITITPTVYDSFSLPQQQGFYLHSSNQITISSILLQPSSNDYVVTATQAGDYSGSASFTFQCDNIISNVPTGAVTTYNFDSGIYWTLVSGIYVISSARSGNPYFTAVVNASNMGYYYYTKPLLTYSSGLTFWTPSNETDLTKIISGSVAGAFTNTNIIFSNTLQSSNLVDVYSNSIPFSVIAKNAFGSSTAISAIPISTIVDGPSVRLIQTTLSQSVPTLTPGAVVSGYRVISGTAASSTVPDFTVGGLSDISATYVKFPYDNTANINNTQDLQVSGGKFTTPNGQTYAYKDYRTYYYTNTLLNTLSYATPLASPTGYRYATFAWKVTNGVFSGLSFRLHNTSNFNINNQLAYAGGSPIQLYYRFEVASNPRPQGTDVNSSAWLNGNSIGEILNTLKANSGNFLNPTDYTQTPNVYGLISPGVTLGNSYFNFPLYINPLTLSSTDTINIYCRIGLPMNIACSFSHISAVIT